MDTENILPTDPPTDPLANMNRKLRYYYRHKDDPVFRDKTSRAKAQYYQRNKEILKQKSLERYYATKNAVNPNPVQTATN
jgi:hypothetical protein